MRTQLKKLTSVCLAVIMLLSVLTVAPITVNAAVDNSESVSAQSGDYVYEVLDDTTASIIRYNGSATNLTIPSTLDGYTVTEIDWGAFEGCTSFTSVIIPESIKRISGYAFVNCVNLKSVTIPRNVFIGTRALGYFYDEESSAYKTVDGFTIYGCAGSVAEDYAVDNGFEFVSINLASDFYYEVINEAEMEVSITDYIGTETDLKIPSTLDGYTVKVVESSAFEGCTSLISVTIPDSVTYIGVCAFKNCTSLSEITIPGSVTGIANSAFTGCSNLTIYGYYGTYAEVYAYSKDLLFIGLDQPTTVAPTTVEPEEPTQPAGTYIVAGSEEVFGSNWGWTDENNLMTDDDGDGIYTLVIPYAGPFENAQFKIGVNGMDGSGSVGPNGDGTIGPNSKYNFQFNIDEVCDLTIRFNPATYEVTYEGEFISPYVLSFEELRAVGNGGNGWLNDIFWDPAADENLMEEIAPGVYQIVMVDVEGNSGAKLKFAADGSWAYNWGTAVYGGVYAIGETIPLTYNGYEMTVVIGEGDYDVNLYTVTVTLDLSNYNDSTKEGATVLIEQEVQTDEPTTVAPTEAPTEIVEETTEKATSAPSDAPLTVYAASNFFSKAEAQYNAETNKVVVSYYLESNKSILNFQIGSMGAESIICDGITYDPEVLKVSDDWTKEKTVPMTGTPGVTVNLKGIEGSIKLNGSKLTLWKVNPEIPFIQIEFEVLDLSDKGPVTTTIGCEVESMIVAELNADKEVDPATEEYLIKNKIPDEANIAKNNVKATTKLSQSTYLPTETTVEPTTAEPTTVEPTTAKPEEPTQPTDTYIVAGSAEVFGVTWDGTAVENMMTDTDGDGVYTLTVTDVQPIANAEFKIVKNGTEWIGPEIGNYVFNVVEACDVTITFNPGTFDVQVAGAGVKEVELIVDSVRAVGNGDAGWLNGIIWDPSADENLMEEIAPGIYQIAFYDVEGYDNACLNFAVNGSWSDSWGGTFAGFDVETDAVYYGDSIQFSIGEGYDDGNLYTVTLTLDLSAFDYASKKGAKFKISQQVQGDVPETTVKETVGEDTTAEPIEMPTTAKPEEPTQPTDTYIVAGSGKVFGVTWDGTAVENMMTDTDGDGVYTLTVTDVQPINNAQFKIVKNGTEWIGPETGNFAFNVVEACDVTITFNPETLEVKTSGTGVTEVELIIDSMRAVGNGGAGWLNDVNWDPAADENLMTEVSPKVYELVMTGVEANMSAQFKFATNGTWSDSWGGTFAGFDVETDAVYNGDSIQFSIGEGYDDGNLYTVTLTLDLSNFDYASKKGAKFKISQQVQPDEPKVIGDVNGDGHVNIDDVTIIQKYLVNLINLSDEQLALADADKDGEVLIIDATLIQKYIMGLAEI